MSRAGGLDMTTGKLEAHPTGPGVYDIGVMGEASHARLSRRACRMGARAISGGALRSLVRTRGGRLERF
jgi:hypothetical protein